MDTTSLKNAAERFVTIELTKELQEAFPKLAKSYMRLAQAKLDLIMAEARDDDEYLLTNFRQAVPVAASLVAGEWELILRDLSHAALDKLPSLIAALAIL